MENNKPKKPFHWPVSTAEEEEVLTQCMFQVIRFDLSFQPNTYIARALGEGRWWGEAVGWEDGEQDCRV